MKKKIIFCLILIMFIIPRVNATTYGELLDDLANAQAKLNANNKAINNKENQIDYNNATISSINNEIVEMGEEVVKLQQEIVDSNEEIKEKEDQIKRLLEYLQTSEGDNTYMQYAFGADSITDFIYRVGVVEQITEANDETINELNKKIQSNEEKKVELSNKQEAYENKKVELNNEINRLNNEITRLEEGGPSLQQEVRDKQAVVDSYKKQGCKNRSDVIGRDCAVTASNGVFRRPMKMGYVTSFTGYRWGSLHRGIDLSAPTGVNTDIYSIGNGVISSIYQDYYGAKCVVVQYNYGGTYYSGIYCHLSSYAPGLYVGKNVTSETILGKMGNTGYSFGVHLHLEVWPCRLYGDSMCSSWNSYVNFCSNRFASGYKGSESVISFPSGTYQYWYSR